jgi:DNA-binding PadR family transcriptional regulator
MNDLLILASLLDGPKHGYALKKRTGAITGKREMHNNLVYPLLKRFVDEGWVKQHRAAGQRGQTREIYSLTSKGKQALLQRLGKFTDKEAPSADAFCLRTGLFGFLDAEKRGEVLEARGKWLEKRAERLAAIARTMQLDEWATETVRHLRNQVEEEQKWLTRLGRLEKQTKKQSSRNNRSGEQT